MWSKVQTMKLYVLLLSLALVMTSLSSAIPKPDEQEAGAGTKEDVLEEKHRNRVKEKELSESEHFQDAEHHNDYDHEAFLGREDAHRFDELSPEESKEKLGEIYDKIDTDKNGKVTEKELKDWIQHVQFKYVEEDTERQWEEQEVSQDNSLTWESYKQRTYGFMDDEEEDDDEDDGYSYKQMMLRDQRRWELADGDKDGRLNKVEFSHFLHPEDVEHMRDVVIDETIEDIDRNKDGVISLEEYIEDMWPSQDRDEEEPDWVRTEREQFSTFRDKNNDGQMDRSEVMDWIIPADYDHSEAEARHLIFESDGDRDGDLTKEEVLAKYDLFVGSQATDFGEYLTRSHDEF